MKIYLLNVNTSNPKENIHKYFKTKRSAEKTRKEAQSYCKKNNRFFNTSIKELKLYN